MKIEIEIDPSLLEHFQENLDRKGSSTPPDRAITTLVARILDGSAYPIEATQTGSTAIRIGYHLRSFSEPIFWS